MKYVLLWLLLCLIWGSTWIAVKIGLADIPPLAFAGARFAIAGSLLLFLRAIAKKPVLPPRQPGVWRFLVLGGVLNFTVYFGLSFWGQQYIPAGLASLIATMSPGFTMLFAHWLIPGERLSKPKIAGLLLGVAGITIIFSDQLHVVGTMAFLGSLAVLLSMCFAGLFAVWVKRRAAANFEPSLVAGWHMLFGCIPLLLGGWLFGGQIPYHWTQSALIALIYLALVGSSLAFFLYYYLLRHLPAGTVSAVSLVAPLVALTLDRLMLGEVPTFGSLAGGALILCGVALIVKPRFPGTA